MDWLLFVAILALCVGLALYAVDYAIACRSWVSTFAGYALAVAFGATFVLVVRHRCAEVTWRAPHIDRPEATLRREASAPAQHPRVTTCPRCGYIW